MEDNYVSKFTGPQIDANLELAQTSIQAEEVQNAVDVLN